MPKYTWEEYENPALNPTRRWIDAEHPQFEANVLVRRLEPIERALIGILCERSDESISLAQLTTVNSLLTPSVLADALAKIRVLAGALGFLSPIRHDDAGYSIDSATATLFSHALRNPRLAGAEGS